MGKEWNKYQHLFDIESESLPFLFEKLGLEKDLFSGKSAFITGGARGIGKQVAIGLGMLGANVIIVDKRISGQKVTNEIIENNGKSIFIKVDISNSEKLVEAYQIAINHYKKVDIVINNAVHFTISSFLDMPFAEWDLHQRTNVNAMVHLCKLSIPQMIKRREGIILNMVGPEGLAYASAMSSSKVAMRSLLYSLSNEISNDSGISILGFAPGLVATELVEDVFIKYCHKVGIEFEDYVYNVADNPGYDGLMPVNHCAAGLIYTLSNAHVYHGVIADAFIPLEKYGIISDQKKSIKNLSGELSHLNTLTKYISEINYLNKRIESKVEERTQKITQEKEIVVNLLKEIRSKNRQLEIVKDELIATKNKAVEASMHKEEFLTNVTHEIRTPLNAIIGFIDLLKDSKLSGEQQDHINAIQISSSKLLRLINEVLDIAKIESGKLDLEPEIFNLPQFLSDLERSASAKANESGDTISLQLSRNVPKLVKGDPNRLHQILINLVGNSIKFTDNGQIKIGVTKEKEEDNKAFIKFCVNDNGIGIPKENLDTIFDTFTQVKGKRNRKHGGSGVGLSIVKQLVNLHNGSISVESEVNKGSKFIITIPFDIVSEKELPQKETIEVSSKALKGINILLAEDNKFNQLLEIKVLENLGANVSLAQNGREAIELIKKETFDVILMDIQMPEMDGIDATLFIRNEMKLDIPIIALTANAFRQDLEKYVSVGMNSCVTKPFKKEVLAKRILDYTSIPL